MYSSRQFDRLRNVLLLFICCAIAFGFYVAVRKTKELHGSSAAGALSPTYREAQYQRHRTSGDSDLDSGDLDGAFLEYSAMVDLFPDRPEGYGLLGSIENSREHSSQAIDDDTKALDRMTACTTACGPTATAALRIDRAKSYQRMGKYDLALQDANTALQQSPNAPGAHLVRAEAELALHQPQQALADSDWAVKKSEDGQVYAYAIRGLSESNVRHTSLMADSALFAQAVRSDAEAALGKYTAAADDAEYVVANGPNHAAFWTDCAWYEFKAGHLAAAIVTARNGLSLQDVSATEYVNLGLYYAVDGNEADSKSAYATALKYKNAATVLPGARDNIAAELKTHPNDVVLHKAQQWLSGH